MHPLDQIGMGKASEAKFIAEKPRSTFPVEPRAEAGKGMERSQFAKFDHCDSQDASICQFSHRILHENVPDCHQGRRSQVFSSLHVPRVPKLKKKPSVSSGLQVVETLRYSAHRRPYQPTIHFLPWRRFRASRPWA